MTRLKITIGLALSSEFPSGLKKLASVNLSEFNDRWAIAQVMQDVERITGTAKILMKGLGDQFSIPQLIVNPKHQREFDAAVAAIVETDPKAIAEAKNKIFAEYSIAHATKRIIPGEVVTQYREQEALITSREEEIYLDHKIPVTMAQMKEAHKRLEFTPFELNAISGLIDLIPDPTDS